MSLFAFICFALSMNWVHCQPRFLSTINNPVKNTSTFHLTFKGQHVIKVEAQTYKGQEQHLRSKVNDGVSECNFM